MLQLKICYKLFIPKNVFFKFFYSFAGEGQRNGVTNPHLHDLAWGPSRKVNSFQTTSSMATNFKQSHGVKRDRQ